MQTELEFLYKLQGVLLDVHRTDKYSEQMLCVSEAQSEILDRIVVLKKEEQREENR